MPEAPATTPALPSLVVVNNIRRELDRAREEGLLPEHEGRQERALKFVRRYGLGLAVGYIVVDWTSEKIRRVPVVGGFIGRLLGALAPVVGPALGAAVAYGIIHEGDAFGARHKIRQGAAQLGNEVNSRVRRAQERMKQELLEGRAKESMSKVGDTAKEGVRMLGDGAKKLSGAGSDDA